MQVVWHGHHNILISFLESIEERIESIKQNKPKSEHALRLKLLKPVRGKLPAAVLKAYAARKKAYAAWGKAYMTPKKADAARKKADAAWGKADAAWKKTYADNLPAIEALHAKECPNCPWNGKTIFPDKGE